MKNQDFTAVNARQALKYFSLEASSQLVCPIPQGCRGLEEPAWKEGHLHSRQSSYSFTVVSWSPGWPQLCYLVKDGLEFRILLLFFFLPVTFQALRSQAWLTVAGGSAVLTREDSSLGSWSDELTRSRGSGFPAMTPFPHAIGECWLLSQMNIACILAILWIHRTLLLS